MTLQQQAGPSRLPASAMPPSDHPEFQATLRKISVCYFLSGALGLIYQILWLRKLLLVFGSTVHAVSTVLTVFFCGLALGSWWFGRAIDRRGGSGLRWYAVLELGIGLYAFITPWLFDMIRHLYIPLYRASGFSPAVLVGASFVCAAAILLLPTTLMGATFPVLSRFVIRSSAERGVAIAGLYGLNTAGAMAGTVFVYYAGLPILGLVRTLLCAGVLNLGIGALCLLFDRRLTLPGVSETGAEPSTGPARDAESVGPVRWLFAAFALSGFSAMVYEVAWTRALSLVLGSSIYAFCIMLATFLGGIAFGSAWARALLRRRSADIRWFIWMELGLGAYGLLSIPLFSRLPQWFVALWPATGGSFSALSWLQFSLCSIVMVLPTVLMGVLFPVAGALVTEPFRRLGQRLGGLYAVNTVGGILGSFLSGFVLIPWWGLPWAIVAAACINLLAGLLLYVQGAVLRTLIPRLALAGTVLGAAVGIGAGVVVPAWKRQAFAAGVFMDPETYQRQPIGQLGAQSKLLYYRDSLNATVSVHQAGTVLFLKVGGKTDASTGVDMGTQVLSAHIPLLLHPDPDRVLVIGLGSGVTLAQAGRHPVSTLHCAELDPAVIEGARYFKEHNDNIHEDPRVRLFAVDGRNFLLASSAQYDVIISEPSNPWMAGLAYLFTREFYALAKQRLAPGGLMCQWLQVYRIFPDDVKLMLATFHEAFPYVSVWSSIPGDLLLVGSMEPQQFDLARVAPRMAGPRIKEGLGWVQIDRPETLLQLFRFGSREIEALAAGARWIHEDDQPLIEFNAPKALYHTATFSLNYDGLEAFKAQPKDIAPGYDASGEDAAFYDALASLWRWRDEPGKARAALERAVQLDPSATRTWIRLGEVAFQSGNVLEAQDAFTKASQLDPDDVLPYQLLGRLHLQQGRLDEARRFYAQAAAIRPPNEALAEEIGNGFRLAGQAAWAAEYYRSAISQGGGARASLMNVYAGTLRELRSLEEAERVLRLAIEAFPNEGAFPLLLGNTLLDQDRWSEAGGEFQRALTLAPKSHAAYYGLARVALAQGEPRQAVQHLRQAVRYHPYYKDALELLRLLQSNT